MKYANIQKIVQLHEQVKIIYVVDGYIAECSFQDGDVHFMDAHGDTIEQALERLDAWLDLYVIVVHTPTRRWYSLNRNYGLNGIYKQAANVIPYRRLHQALPNETTCGSRYSPSPEWAANLPDTEFTCHWMY